MQISAQYAEFLKDMGGWSAWQEFLNCKKLVKYTALYRQIGFKFFQKQEIANTGHLESQP